MLVDKVLNFAAEGFCQADNHIDLGFAQVILFLLVELHHAQSNTGCIAQLLLRKATSFPDGVQLRFPGLFVSANNGICRFHELAVFHKASDVFLGGIKGNDGCQGRKEAHQGRRAQGSSQRVRP